MPQMPIYHAPSNRRRFSAWDRFNDFFANIGEWLQDRYEDIESFFFEKIVPVIFVILIIGVVIGAIVTWVTEGFWYFVLYVIGVMILGGIVYGLLEIVLGLFILILRVLIFILRLIFTNATTFLITVGITIGLIIGILHMSNSHSRKKQVKEIVQPTTTYVCTASKLNVRSYASTNAAVIGKLRKGERIQVYEIKNGFAKIKYNNGFGYVSERYITAY